MEDQFQVISQSFVNVFITSTATCFTSERRFQRAITISELKMKLELITGVQASLMELEVYSKSDEHLCNLHDNDALLGSFPIDDGARIHVTDTSNRSGDFEKQLEGEKFTLSDADYAKRSGTVKTFLQSNKLGKYSDENGTQAKLEEEYQKQLSLKEKSLAISISVGSRCEVKVPGQATRRGSVMYVGLAHFKEGWWVGIKYDEPLGKNDGSVEGKRYFQCLPKYGGFVKPQHVTVGEFPEEDFGLDDDEM